MGNYPFSYDGGLTETTVRLFASKSTWIEGAAVQQLETTAKLPGMKLACGFPDLHPGKGFPVGAAFVSEGMFHPVLAGNDIGCAMGFWQTDLPARKLKLDRWAGKLGGLDEPWDGDVADWRERYGLPESPSDAGLGTIGGGNHFAELQIVEEVQDAAAFSALGLDKDRLGLLVHSGSRGLGEAIYRELLHKHGANALTEDTDDAERYLARHAHAERWAAANRALIAARFVAQLGAEAALVSDVPHNLVTREAWSGRPCWIHRKGAASSRCVAVMIPGSRGTLSYLVKPLGDGEGNAHSLAHGAGRRWQRGYAKPRLSHKYRVADLERTPLGSRVICEDRELIYEEAPQAYKDIGQIVADLSTAGLASVIAVYRPLITYKTRRQP
ncbi:MAG: RNA ligase RtcB family protein [Hyphomicrobiaceae bacterium]|nr:MAG: RNA ligase RtcB family protein [Hyphomicrobiaceae bacterium]